jgi:hypothetical protein
MLIVNVQASLVSRCSRGENDFSLSMKTVYSNCICCKDWSDGSEEEATGRRNCLEHGEYKLKVFEEWRELLLNDVLSWGDVIITAVVVFVLLLIEFKHGGCHVVQS